MQNVNQELRRMLDDAMEQYHLAHDQIKKQGSVLLAGAGKTIMSPYVEVGNKYCDRIIKISKALDLLPLKNK